MFSRHPDLGLVWKFKKVTKVNSELFQEYYVKNVSVKIQLNAGKCWGVYNAAWPWATLKVEKGCIKINIKHGQNSDVKKIPVKLQHGTYNFWGVIAFRRSFDLGLDWKFKKVTQRSTSNLVKILMRTSLSVKLQHDAGKFWGIIIFTRSCDKGQHQTHPRLWCGKYLCKITTWCLQLLRTYRVHKTTWA